MKNINEQSAELDWYMVSLVVQVKPEKLHQVKQDLLALPNTEVHGENLAESKLVVTMEADVQWQLVERVEKIKEIDGVIVVSLIYNYVDERGKQYETES